ncbi:Peptidase dimerisation domain [Bacteroides xylanisolvens]|nr:Peptidase dimerisation domain [Bacteroides xylanisolvens]
MESGRLDHCMTVGRKGCLDCHITVRGVAAHAGNDYVKGRNAIVEMAKKLPLLQSLTIYEEGLTVSVGTIKGGMLHERSLPSHPSWKSISMRGISD